MLRIDTGCIVAFTPGVSYNIQRAGSLKSMFLAVKGYFWRRCREPAPCGFRVCLFHVWPTGSFAVRPPNGGQTANRVPFWEISAIFWVTAKIE